MTIICDCSPGLHIKQGFMFAQNFLKHCFSAIENGVHKQ